MTGWLVFLMFAGMLLVGLAPAWRVAPLPGRPWLVSVPGLLVLSGMLAVLVTQLLGQGGLVSVWQALGSAGLLAAALLAFVMLAYTLVRPSMLALQYSRTPQEKALDIEDVESRALVLLPVGRVFAHGDRRLFLLLCLGCMVLILWQFVDGLPTDPVLREQVAWGLLGVALLAAASLLVLVVQPWGILLVQPQNREDAEAFYLLVMMVFVPLAGRAGATLPTMLESAGGAAILLMLFCALMCFVSLLRFRRQARRGNAMLCYLGSVLLMLLVGGVSLQHKDEVLRMAAQPPGGVVPGVTVVGDGASGPMAGAGGGGMAAVAGAPLAGQASAGLQAGASAAVMVAREIPGAGTLPGGVAQAAAPVAVVAGQVHAASAGGAGMPVGAGSVAMAVPPDATAAQRLQLDGFRLAIETLDSSLRIESLETADSGAQMLTLQLVPPYRLTSAETLAFVAEKLRAVGQLARQRGVSLQGLAVRVMMMTADRYGNDRSQQVLALRLGGADIARINWRNIRVAALLELTQAEASATGHEMMAAWCQQPDAQAAVAFCRPVAGKPARAATPQRQAAR